MVWIWGLGGGWWWMTPEVGNRWINTRGGPVLTLNPVSPVRVDIIANTV